MQDKKLFKQWKRFHLRRLELVLYQYSLGVVTGGTVAEELRLLKILDDLLFQQRREITL